MEGIEEALYWHTVGIVAERGKTIGTATAIRWKNNTLLLTANHVIEKTLDCDLGFFFRPPGTLKHSDWWQKSPQTGPVIVPSFPKILQRHQDPRADIAALLVPANLEQENNVKFFDLGEGVKLPRRINSSLAAIGFPADSQERLAPMAAAIGANRSWLSAGNPIAASDEFMRLGSLTPSPRSKNFTLFSCSRLAGTSRAAMSALGSWWR